MESIWAVFVAFVLSVWAMGEVKVLLCTIVVNFVVAVAAAIFGKIPDFDLARIGEFLYRKALPFVIVWVIAKAIGEAAGMGWLAIAAWGILQITLLADLADSLRRLGIPIPDWGVKLETLGVLDDIEQEHAWELSGEDKPLSVVKME